MKRQIDLGHHKCSLVGKVDLSDSLHHLFACVNPFQDSSPDGPSSIVQSTAISSDFPGEVTASVPSVDAPPLEVL